MRTVVDASVALKIFVDEPGKDEALALCQQPLAAPDCMLVECAQALARKVRRGEVSGPTALVIASALNRIGIVFEPVHDLAEEALDLSLRLSLSAYDCVYLALARKLGAVFVTADARLVARCAEADAAALKLSVVRLGAGHGPAIQERLAAPYRARRARRPSRRSAA